MSKPHPKKAITVPSKTMFYTEGNPAATLVINKGGNRTQSVMDFPSAEAAVGWCRQHGANLFYMAVNISSQ